MVFWAAADWPERAYAFTRCPRESGPFSEVRGVAAKIDGYVPDVSGEDADEFALRLLELVVQAT